MVLRHVVDRRLALLASYAGYLEELARTPEAELVADFRASGAARYYLQVGIECAIDVGAHIIASDTPRRAESYRDIFRILEEEGVIDPALAAELLPSAALRNRLVHAYDTIDDALVHGMLGTASGVLRRFAQAVADYLERVSG